MCSSIPSQVLETIVVLQVGDGTTTVVLLAGEFLKAAKPFIEEGVHPQNLIRSYRTASTLVRIITSSLSNYFDYYLELAVDTSLMNPWRFFIHY